ncbi:hypothetical protein MJO28_012899 [Puccinia striiformis f. sp. tritici]|uniref:Uncharacterized protein n=1 Tax=Puccinia striiformis f. sp. tritici TaxID=168172 RepID=A0ACC0DX23_9BASI|nr:hypothetical protein MJO28_012899 [Puccinia striiformis f. sp. tritici]
MNMIARFAPHHFTTSSHGNLLPNGPLPRCSTQQIVLLFPCAPRIAGTHSTPSDGGLLSQLIKPFQLLGTSMKIACGEDYLPAEQLPFALIK